MAIRHDIEMRLRAKGWLFFDSKQILEAFGKARTRYLAQGGSYVMTTAKNSIKKKGKARTPPKIAGSKAFWRWREEIMKQPASSPGTPPFTHTGFLRNDIIFAADPRSRTCVIGPVTAPWLNELHEYGGQRPMYVYQSKDGSTFLDKSPSIGRYLQPIRRTTAQYPRRSFMNRAIGLPKVQAKLKDIWKDAVKK